MGIISHPITNQFALNSKRHNYNTRHTHDLEIIMIMRIVLQSKKTVQFGDLFNFTPL